MKLKMKLTQKLVAYFLAFGVLPMAITLGVTVDGARNTIGPGPDRRAFATGRNGNAAEGEDPSAARRRCRRAPPRALTFSTNSRWKLDAACSSEDEGLAT